VYPVDNDGSISFSFTLSPSGAAGGSGSTIVDGTTATTSGDSPTLVYPQDLTESYLVGMVWVDSGNLDSVSVAATVLPPPTEVWVDDDYCDVCANDGHIWGYDAFDNIQDGIDAVEGSTIHVAGGTYNILSQIIIDKSIDIVGDPLNNPVIHADTDFGSYMVKADSTVAATINISNLVFDGSGHDVYAALRLYDVHNGTVEHCTFQNIVCAGYVGLGIVIYGDGFTFANNTFANIGRVGIWVGASTGSGCVITNNTYTGKGTGDWLDYAIEVGMGGIATITDNTITDCTGVASVDGSTSAGIMATTYYGSGTQATITGNNIVNCTDGIAVGYDASDTSSVEAYHNNITGNDYGVYSTGPLVNAVDNWWGDATGPKHAATNPCASGDEVSDNVDYTSWLDAAYPGGSQRSYNVENITQSTLHNCIQEAIDAAYDGDTLNVLSGTYNENVVIAKSLSLTGASSATTIINGNNSGNTVTITASNVMLSGFKVTGGWSNSGSVFTPYGGVVIDGNGGISALTGITIEDNAVEDNYGNGIFVSASGDGGAENNVVIRNCDILNNVGGAGISLTYLSYSGPEGTWEEWRRPKNILIEGNTLDGNSDYGIYVNAGKNNVIKSNSISGSEKYGLQLAASMPRTEIPCEYTTVEDNDIYENQRNGVKLTSYNQYNTFTENEIYNNGTGGTSDRYKYGFLFQDGNNNTIQDNIISGNALGGLYLWGKGDPSYTWYSTTDNIIIRNTIYDHTADGGHGIYIPAQYGNPNSGFLNSHINYNNIIFNLAYGLENADDTQTVDAEYNWWGDFNGTGPYDGTGVNGVPPCTDDPTTEINSDGMGDEVSDNVDYCPWIPFPLDTDADDIPNFMDNCPETPNPFQEDTRPPGGNWCGDACECEGNFDGDGSVGGNDVDLFKANMGRNQWDRPCSVCSAGPNAGKFCQNDADCPDGECAPDPLDPCKGDFDCDGSVGGSDVDLFKADMGRNQWDNPCPACSGVTCSYD